MESCSPISSRYRDSGHLEHKGELECKGHGSVVDAYRERETGASAFHSASGSPSDGKRNIRKDKDWLAAAMILGLLASYPLVIKPLHQVSTDMLSKMRGNLKTGAI